MAWRQPLIFINYRRKLNLAEAQLLQKALQRHFGKDGVFLDIEGSGSGRALAAHARGPGGGERRHGLAHPRRLGGRDGR